MTSHQPRRHWPSAVWALAVALAMAISATVWWSTNGSESYARSRWQPPPQSLLSSLRTQPVPGWTTSVTALGLPPGTRITRGDDYDERQPLALVPGPGNDTVYLTASSPDPIAPQWWLVGVSVRDERGLFRPVALNKSNPAPRCFVNGPAVVCVADDFENTTAWVIDGHTGEVGYSGPTTLRLKSGEQLLSPMQVGRYLLAGTDEQGVYGIGPKAEPTWFVAGSGRVSGFTTDTTFLGAAKSGRGVVMISSRDGKTISPQLPDGAWLGAVEPFADGGFAAEVFGVPGSPFVQFFYSAGRLVSDRRIEGQLGATAGDLTSVLSGEHNFGIYGSHGDKLLGLSEGSPYGIQVIGTTLYVNERRSNEDSHWQTYDMRTGAKGKSVQLDFDHRYLGTDGHVALRAVVNPKADQLARAFDLETGAELWSIPTTAGSLGRLYLVDTTLIQVSDDGTQLFSLVPPA